MELGDEIIMSDAAWAWEGLRRNPAYRKAWERHRQSLPDVSDQQGSVRYLRLDQPYFEAEQFGLVAFADPDLPASEAPVLWQPTALAGVLSVRLAAANDPLDEGFSLSQLRCCPFVVDASDGVRHVRLGGFDFWIQLQTDDLVALSDDTRVVVELTGRPGMSRRLKTADQLLTLHRPDRRRAPTPTRIPNRAKLMEGLLAYDVQSGLAGRKGSLKDIAKALFGDARIKAEWTTNRSLKNHAVRARDRGRAFVRSGYRRILRSAAF
ncbi:MAG: DUF2285 domain-containing protein [Pseudomonadota bacterium]